MRALLAPPTITPRNSTLFVLGARQRLPPLAHPLPSFAAVLAEQGGMSWTWALRSNQTKAQWEAVYDQMRQQRVPVHVSVLGMSATGGCGSNEPLHAIRVNSTVMPLHAKRCSMNGAWPRLMHDELTRVLREHGYAPRLRVHVGFRNAAGASFFSHCTKAYVPEESQVVVIDVGCNLQAHELPLLINGVRRAAPEEVIVMMMWRPQSLLRRFKRSAPKLSAIDLEALALGADVVRVDAVAWHLLFDKKVRLWSSLTLQARSQQLPPFLRVTRVPNTLTGGSFATALADLRSARRGQRAPVPRGPCAYC